MAPWCRLALVLALLPAASSADGLRLGVLGVATADLAMTHVGLSAGGRDLNPMVRGHGSAVAVKAGMTMGVLLLDREFRRRGHDRGAKVLKVATIIVWGSCAAWNMRQIHRMR